MIDSTDFSNPGALNKVDIKVPEFHTVEKGDNIYRIAEKYHVLEEDLLAWNSDLNPSAMRIGQKIYLTKKAADANGTASKEVKEVNDAALKTKKDIEKASKEVVVDGQVTHVVVKGDTLYNICKRYNVTVDQLKVWNNLEDINIKLGQKLKVSE